LQRLAEELETAITRAPAMPWRFLTKRLALMFLRHPAIDAGVAPPLILQTLLGLDAAMIASGVPHLAAAMGNDSSSLRTRSAGRHSFPHPGA